VNPTLVHLDNSPPTITVSMRPYFFYAGTQEATHLGLQADREDSSAEQVSDTEAAGGRERRVLAPD